MTALATVSIRVACKLVNLSQHTVLVLARQGYLELIIENNRRMVTKASIQEYQRLVYKGGRKP
jgi:predicted site-specific integrase-resolvase